MSDDFYDFESNHCTAQSLVHSINFLGENIIGVEVGIYRALNLCMLVQLCKNVKMLYGIDNYKPYTDFKYSKHFGEKEQDNNKMLAYHNIKYSGFKDKIKIIEKDKNRAEFIANLLNDTIVINGNGLDEDVLNEANFNPENLITDAILSFENGKILSIELNLKAFSNMSLVKSPPNLI